MKKSKLGMAALSTLLFAGSTLLFGMGSSAQAATFDPNAMYKIVNVNSGKVMDVAHASIEASYRIHQWTYLGLPNQHWQIKTTTDGYYSLVNVKSGMAVDVLGTSNGAKVHQWFWDQRETEKFSIQTSGNGYQIMSKPSFKMLDVEHNSYSDGANVHLWQYTPGVTSQFWNIVQI